MKLTWFGGTTFRVHVGGAIVVVEAAGAPAGIDGAELVSGADRIVAIGEAPIVDMAAWRPRRVARPLDEAGHGRVECWNAGAGAMLIEAPGEPVLLIVSRDVPPLGRWADDAVIVIAAEGEGLAALGAGVLAQHAPRLLALAGSESAMDRAIDTLRGKLDGTGLVALEAGMALEV